MDIYLSDFRRDYCIRYHHLPVGMVLYKEMGMIIIVLIPVLSLLIPIIISTRRHRKTMAFLDKEIEKLEKKVKIARKRDAQKWDELHALLAFREAVSNDPSLLHDVNFIVNHSPEMTIHDKDFSES